MKEKKDCKTSEFFFIPHPSALIPFLPEFL